MESVSMSHFRAQMSKYFDRASSGDCVLVHRGTKMFTLVPVTTDDIELSPALQQRFDAAHQSLQKGECVACNNHQQLHELLDAL